MNSFLDKIPERFDSKVIVICILLSLGIFMVDSLIPLGVTGGILYIPVILISLWSPIIKLPIYMAIIGSILTIIGFYSSPPGGEIWKVLTNRSLILFAIWSVAIIGVKWKTIHKEKEKTLLEVKILSGLLPICASCKKIRDDKGYWNQIESYIRDHSDAEFSHGICPDCVKKLYPNIEL